MRRRWWGSSSRQTDTNNHTFAAAVVIRSKVVLRTVVAVVCLTCVNHVVSYVSLGTATTINPKRFDIYYIFRCVCSFLGEESGGGSGGGGGRVNCSMDERKNGKKNRTVSPTGVVV